ncbi:plexin a4 [Echinococcus multilocularis]|uniref:Plexin a4 n=1 Tax=Echinococcus multilocularis TaxID=6211 RepID=A0A068YB82_ECHMU|nr:plexin a4 [Echinococcus multilocularis]
MLETRIVRVCSGDKFLHSYADLELSCEGCFLPDGGQAQKKFGALNVATRGTIGTEAAMPRFARLNNSKVVPKWHQPLSFSDDFNNVLLVAFASQLTELVDYVSAWKPNFEAKNPLIRGTAIVFYTLAEIDAMFGLVIHNCLIGKTSIGPPHFLHGYPKKCDKDGPLLPLLKLNHYCPTNPMNWPISGSIQSERLSAPPILMLNVDATGIAITRVADAFTVLVVTTDEGELLKYAVEVDGEARLITSKQLTSRRKPLRGLTLDDTGLVAFAISDEKVYRVELQNCSALDSCGACLALRDPYCGWCLAEGVCTHKAACGTPWLPYRASASRCPKIALMDPPGMDINRRGGSVSGLSVLTLRPSAILSAAFTASLSTATGWLGRQRRLLCAFRYPHPNDRGGEVEPSRRRGPLYVQTEASLIPGSSNISCNLPEPTELPTLGRGEQLKETLVWLELAESSTASKGSAHPLAAGVFTIYDCRRFTDCQVCLSSRFDCMWHLIEGRCLSSTDSRNSYLTSPLPFPPNRPKPALICTKFDCKCPLFVVDQVITTIEALKPVSVVASVSNILTLAERFSCSENCTGQWTTGVYNRTSSTVTCNFSGISVPDVIRSGGNATGLEDAATWHHNLLNFVTWGVVKCEIKIHWHNDRLPNQPELGHPLANLEAASLEVFECSRMAAYCDSCLALPPRFACVWCSTVSTSTAALEGTMGCLHAERCPHLASVTFCPHLQLLKVIPENATLSGQTPLTIRGLNLGSELKDLEITAVFANSNMESIACTVIPEGFQPSRQVTCRLQPMKRRPKQPEAPLKCHITLRLRKAHTQTTSLPFTFLSPQIESFSPQRGPIAGGTLLRIYGRDLNVGAFVTVVLVLSAIGGQNNVKCEVIYLSAGIITCRTQAIDSTLLSLASELDSGATDGIPSSVALFHDKTLTKAPFQIFVYKPNPAIRTVSETLVFLSGGTIIHVYGQYLDVIESPQIVFYHNGMEFVEACRYEHVYLCCVSPSLTLDVRRKRAADVYSSTIVRPITNPSIIPKIYSFEHDDDNLDNLGKTNSAIVVPYGFIMDNVTDVLVLGVFSVFPNPEVFPFVEGRLIESFTPRLSSATSKETSVASTDGGVMEGNHLDSNVRSGKSSSVQDRHLLRFHGNFEALVDVSDLQALKELSIIVVTGTAENQTNRTCKPVILKTDEIRCELNLNDLVEGKDYPIIIQFGKYLKFRPGVVQFKRLGPLGGRDRAVIVASSLMGAVTLVACLFLAMWCRSRRTERDLEKRFQIRWAEQEKCVARAFKNDFIELQTHVEELVQDLNRSSLPIRDYQTYCLFSLFPEYHLSLVRPSDPHDMPPRTAGPRPDSLEDVSVSTLLPHPLVSVFKVPANVQEVADRGIFLFNRLLHNNHFLCLLVHAIESNRNIDARAKSQIASLLSIILHPDMEYFTQIILSLITDLLRKSRDHGGDSRLLTAFRRAESVIAKMLSNWFTFLLYNFIREHAAEHLFILYRALRQQINTGPRDAVTGLARYTLDAATLLKSDLLSRPIMLLVVDPEGLFGPLCPANMAVRVLSCDTVTQAKEKILDAIYRNTPYKSQLRPTDVHLKKLVGAFDSGTEFSGSFEKAADLLMMDWDLDVRRDATNTSIEGPPYRLNCLSDYKMTDNDVVALVRAGESPLLTNGGGTLPAAASRVAHSCTSPNGSLPLPLHQPLQPPPLLNSHQQAPFNMRPTGGPSALLWYHLERPTNADLQVTERSEWARREKEERGLGHLRPLCCHPRSRLMSSASHPSPSSSSPTLPAQQQQPCGGLDARSLRRWLATEMADTSTVERARTSQRRHRRSLGKPGGPRSDSGAAYEIVELSNNWSGEPDAAIDRPMAKLPCEIFLNRLLRTRVSVAKYTDRVVELIFGAVMDSQSPPLCIKFLFDFLDQQAEALGIHDPGVLHAWKANCLHLRFWNQILINLDYVFDIPLLRNTALERSFHSFSQAITYACSPVLDKVTMDSPINKALFSSDIERHWLTVKKYFAEIKAMPSISQHDVNVSLCQHSKNHKNEFNVSWALYELYTRYVTICYDTLITELRTVVTTEASASDLSCNAMGNTESYPYSHGTSSLRGDFLDHQNNNWNPLCLLQTLQEVNSCMMTVICSGSKNSSNDKLSTSKPPPSSPQSSVLQPHHQLSNGRGQSSLRSVVPNSERKLPPLPTPP